MSRERKRVVVTGMGGVSSLGSDLETIFSNLEMGQSGVSKIPEWEDYESLGTKVGGRVSDFALPSYYDRKKVRFMGRVARFAVRASELALEDSGLLGTRELGSGNLGVAYGSATGSPTALSDFGPLWFGKEMKEVSATSYLQLMSHTCAANISVYFGISGRLIPSCSACTSGSQAIGFAYETIAEGRQSVMLAGGAEELCVTIAAVFDSVAAASCKSNEAPETASRPFDSLRDGVVVGEGAATLVLEELSHARARGAKIYAEVVGFGTNSDSLHLAKPHAEPMESCIRLGLADAGISPAEVGYVNAHATSTTAGDLEEACATAAVFGRDIAISSLKGHFGHTLGACGALEAWLSIEMLRRGCFIPTLNLDSLDPLMPEMDYLAKEPRRKSVEYLVSNNFAFGGTNTCLVFKSFT